MDKEKLNRLKKSFHLDLPEAPPDPNQPAELRSPVDKNDPFARIEGYKQREMQFLCDLHDTCKSSSLSPVRTPAKDSSVNYSSTNEDSGLGNRGSDWESDDLEAAGLPDLEKEVQSYFSPLMSRANASVSVALSTKGALDQLDSLHKLVHQFMHLQEQNLRMTRAVKTTNTLLGLKMVQNQNKEEREKLLNEPLSDDEFDTEIEQNMRLLETILAAGSSASSKRGSSKRQRSKSVISDDGAIGLSPSTACNYPLRRQSAIIDFKPKVSKWTKVKAAFKWEKANALPATIETKHCGKNVLAPVNNEVARYLKVPTTSSTGISSGDSIISTSSRDLGIAQSPDYLSSESSVEEPDQESGQKVEDQQLPKRSGSLDGDVGIPSHRGSGKSKSRSAWSKVKGIVKTNRGSIKSGSRGAGTSIEGSRDVSPCDSIDTAAFDTMDRNDSFSSSNQTSPGIRNPTPTFTLTTVNDSTHVEDRPFRPSRKGKHVPDIESLPEGIPLGTVSKKPSPLTIKTDSSDDLNEFLGSLSRNKTVSMPNSPLKKSFDFFNELESAEVSSNDKSEPATPRRRLSDKTKNILRQREEIKRNYLELQKRLQQEFESKQVEWEKLRPALSSTSSIQSDLGVARPMLREADLPPDFKKKLEEWRTKKDHRTSSKESSKEPEKKKPDWESWKTGQCKLPGQGLSILPNAKDLPEDFQKKLSEWKQMKAANKVPPYSPHFSDNLKRQSLRKFTRTTAAIGSAVRKSKTADDIEKHKFKLRSLVTSDAPKKEVVIQTNQGVMKFEGISREFTRKLYEWEKARGIKPESSTFAFFHPGYKPVIVESGSAEKSGDKKHESPALQRSFSCDSISPNVSHPSISHQPSSLSLNDMDELKENAIRKRNTSSNPDLFDKEPEAVIVEVEDEIGYISALDGGSLFDEPYSGHDADYFSILTTIEGMRDSLTALIDCLPKMSLFMAQRTVPLKLIKQLASEIVCSLNDLEDHLDEKKDIDVRTNSINDLLVSLKDVLEKVSLKQEIPKPDDFIPEISITPEYGAHAVLVEACRPTATAVVNVTPIYVCEEKSVARINPERKSSDFDSGASAPQSSSLESEKQDKKLQRNLSTGSRRKVRLKRMGSRQNSKTEESDSEEEALNYVLEAPKKVKRKTSKCKKSDSLEKAEEKQAETIFVFKIKPSTESQEVTYDFMTKKDESKDENWTPISASVLIKIKRKIFAPIDTNTKGEIVSVTGVDVDSSSSEKTDPKKPPLPQSPSVQRRGTNGKEVSPNIKLMIAKYNKITETSKSPTPSGSCSPVAWRSPVFDRRVKLQTAKYQEQVALSKSASTGSVKNQKLEVHKTKSTESVKEDYDVYDTVLSYDALKKKLMKNLESQKTVIDDISKLTSDVERTWALQQQDTSKGAIRKNPDYNRSTSCFDKTGNTQPKITRKSEARPMLKQSISISPDSLSDAPRSPLTQRAERLRRAKEEFLKQPLPATREQKSESRLSQLSALSDDTSIDDEPSVQKSASTGTVQAVQMPKLETSKPESKLNFLTSKLRKVKLRKDSKELPKQGAVSALCRTSLVADITGESSKADKSNSSSRNSLNASDSNVKKSHSTIFARFWRPGKEKLKKSRSLGLLNQTIDVKRKESH